MNLVEKRGNTCPKWNASRRKCGIKHNKTIDDVTSPFFVEQATREGKCLQRTYKNNNIFQLFLKVFSHFTY